MNGVERLWTGQRWEGNLQKKKIKLPAHREGGGKSQRRGVMRKGVASYIPSKSD